MIGLLFLLHSHIGNKPLLRSSKGPSLHTSARPSLDLVLNLIFEIFKIFLLALCNTSFSSGRFRVIQQLVNLSLLVPTRLKHLQPKGIVLIYLLITLHEFFDRAARGN